MPFEQEVNLTKDSIKDFEIKFFVPDPNDADGVQTGELDVQIGMSDGSIQTRSYDLLAKSQEDAAGQEHLQNMVAYRDYIRTRLENEVLP